MFKYWLICNQSRRRNLRADIVEDHAGQQLRRDRCEDVDDQPAARRAEKHRAIDPEHPEPGNHIAGFSAYIIMREIGIVGRQPAPAKIEADHAPRRFRVVRKHQRQFVEIPGVARQAGQADIQSGRFRRLRRLIHPRVKLQPIRRIVEIS